MDPFPNIRPNEYQGDISFLGVQIKRIRETLDDLIFFFDFENASQLIQYQHLARQVLSQDRQQRGSTANLNNTQLQQNLTLPTAPPRIPRQSPLTPSFPQILTLLKQLTEDFQQIQTTLQKKQVDFEQFVITPTSRPMFSDVLSTQQTQQHIEQLYALHAQYISQPLDLPLQFELQTKAFLQGQSASESSSLSLFSPTSQQFQHTSDTHTDNEHNYSTMTDNVNDDNSALKQTYNQQLKLLQSVHTLGGIVVSDPDVLEALQTQDLKQVIHDLVEFNAKLTSAWSALPYAAKLRQTATQQVHSGGITQHANANVQTGPLVVVDNQFAYETFQVVDFHTPQPLPQIDPQHQQLQQQQQQQLQQQAMMMMQGQHYQGEVLSSFDPDPPNQGQLDFQAFERQLQMIKTGDFLRGD